MATTGVNPDGSVRNRLDQLPRQVMLAGWPRPTVGNGSGGQVPPEGTTTEGRTPDGRKVTVALPFVTQLAGWPRPKYQNGNASGPSRLKAPTYMDLQTAAMITGHPTERSDTVIEYRFTPSSIGEMPTGCSAVIPTERVSGPLNPAHSLWLMLGPFGTAWLRCAERVTLSTSRKRRASSKR